MLETSKLNYGILEDDGTDAKSKEFEPDKKLLRLKIAYVN